MSSQKRKKGARKIGNLPEARVEPGVEASSGMKAEGKKETLPEDKSAKTPDTAGEMVKAGQKKRKEKPAVLRQYNLGDYL
ncbi:MAG: hypothetical protein NHB15_17975 [Methanosarcina barkeri]|nr:hypothetical protein [Methanosarcina sp. ERenArc_MAG2]